MKQTILLGLLLFSIAVGAQDFYSSGDCKANFKFEVNRNINTLLPATAINFYDTSVGKVKAWYWDCGDSITSTEQNPMIIFNHPIGGPNVKINPYRTVRLTIVTDSCKSTFSQLINIIDGTLYEQQKCKVAFGYDAKDVSDSTQSATLVNFFSKSYPEAKEWFWDFGDGTTSTEAFPTHVFKLNMSADSILIDPNPFRTICLTVITADGCKANYCETVNVFDIGTSPNEPACNAVFKYYESGRDTIGGTAKIVFNNYSEGKDLKYFWQFGDGTTSTEKEPVVKFSLDQPEYKVCLTVTGADSCTSTICQPVYMEYPIDTIVPRCFVDFGFERNDLLMTPLPSAVFNFYYKSFPEATEWYWDFGDGTTSNEPKPTHVYIKPFMNDSMKVMYNPFRTVCLTIKTADGCKISSCQTIQVFDYNPEPEKCPVYFKYYEPNDMVSIPEVVPVKLVDVSQGDVISRLWQFEDGKTSTEKEPLVSFSIFQPVHKVCLTVTFADSCTNTFCSEVYINSGYVDTVIIEPACPYYIKVDGGFPIQMSSCAGWASAKVYLGDSLVTPEFISWSTGDTIAAVKGLCPTMTYTVKAAMPGGCVVWTNFILGADGSITPVSPVNWWLSGSREKMYVQSDAGKGMKVEWRLCDGTLVEADSIPLDAINCGGNLSNMIIKDLMGNVVYTENIALKGSFTGIEDIKVEPSVKLWPNPVTSKLNIRYSGEYQSKINVEICDIMGKMVSTEMYSNISDGTEFSINTESLKQGIYICRISAEGKVIKAEKFSRR
jgi:PKD repeat protein